MTASEVSMLSDLCVLYERILEISRRVDAFGEVPFDSLKREMDRLALYVRGTERQCEDLMAAARMKETA